MMEILSNSEITMLLTLRAEQLDAGSPPLISTRYVDDSLEIAEKELRAGVCNLMIERKYDDGRVVSIKPSKEALSRWL